jgi:hypothetical protein
MKKKIAICLAYFERKPGFEAAFNSFQKFGYFDDDYPYDVVLSIVDDGSIVYPLDVVDTPKLKVTKLPEKHDWRNPSVPIYIAIEQIQSEYLLLQTPTGIHRGDVIQPMMDNLKDERDIVLMDVKKCDPGPFWWCQLMKRSFYNKIGKFDIRFRAGNGWEDTDLYNRSIKNGANFIQLKEPGAYRHIEYKTHPVNQPCKYKKGSKEDPNYLIMMEKHGRATGIRIGSSEYRQIRADLRVKGVI